MHIPKRPLPFHVDRKWGYIDIDGSLLHEAVFDYAGRFREGYSCVEQGSSLLILDEKFNVVGQVPRASPGYVPFSGGLLVVENLDTQQAFYVDTEGRRPFNKEFDNALSFSGDRAFVQVGQRWGMLDRSGQWIIEPSLAWAISFEPDSDITAVCPQREDGPWQLIDREGRTVSPRKFDLLRCVAEGLVAFGERDADGYMRFGIADATGRELIPPTFYECNGAFREGLLDVESEDEKYGVIDRTGHWVIHPNYTFVGECRHGLLLAYKGGGRTLDYALKDGAFGFIDRTGSVKIDFQFDEAFPFDDGIAKVGWYIDAENDNYDTLSGYVTLQGRIIWKEEPLHSGTGIGVRPD